MAALAHSSSCLIQLAQRLAGNEQVTRDRAVKRLRKYIVARTQLAAGGFTHDELLKVWKGLFYCMWMQDKPLLQVILSGGPLGLFRLVRWPHLSCCPLTEPPVLEAQPGRGGSGCPCLWCASVGSGCGEAFRNSAACRPEARWVERPVGAGSRDRVEI
uniref:Ribosomal RNA processing 1 n=1 Tax=Ursus americanus TaxID=9643 RepID=A0A452SR40_URSAM